MEPQNLKTFEELVVWQRCRKLRVQLGSLSLCFPKSEKYRLHDQILRASRSVTANIAEGFGRFHYQENIQFCRMARGSLYEILDHLICASDSNYISQGEYLTIRKEIIRCIQLVNGYIRYLKKAKTSRITLNE